MGDGGLGTYISDQETKVDFLRNDAIAKTIVGLILERDDRPITIGVHGDWGAGKSSILEMVESGVADRKDDSLLCLKFNGWQFQGFEDAKIAVIEGVVTELIAQRSLMTKFADETKNVLRSINWLKGMRRLGGLAFNFATGLPSPDQVGDLIGLVTDKLSDPSTFVTAANAQKVAGELRDLWKPEAATRSVPDEIREFQAAFAALLKKADVKRLIVLVDDLDRCLPEIAIQTLEAIRLFVLLPRTAFIVGADESMIEYAVRRHFPNLPEDGKWQDYPRAYLEKLIQVPFRIPAMGETETRIYVTMLLVASCIGEGAPEFDKLLKHAQALLSEPWRRRTVEESDVKDILGGKYSESVRSAVLLGTRIAPVLARGTSGNPRKVKRFINALNLRLRVSDARGFGKNIDPQILAKIMLGEHFLPKHVFDRIAGASATSGNGMVEELQRAEQRTRTEVGSGKGDVDGIDDAASDSIVAEWLVRPEVVRWLKLDPQLSNVNLQPYLFVINDSKSFMGADDFLSAKLLDILEKLCGGEFSAKNARGSLSSLDRSEVTALFKELRVRVLTEKDLSTRPDSLLGLIELVSTHGEFDLQYVEVLHDLSVAMLGVWVATGHDRVIKSESAKTRLNECKAIWKKDGSPSLKAALSGKSGARKD